MHNAIIIFQKEYRTEFRSKSGLYMGFFFSLLAVIAMSLATYGHLPSPTLAAGMFSIVLLFAAVITIPRPFLIEEEQATLDLIRLMVQPIELFLGKALFCFLQMMLTGLLLSILFTAMTAIQITHFFLFFAGVFFECTTLCLTTSLCSALSIGAKNQWLLVSILSIPLLLPQLAMSIGVLRVSFGEGTYQGGISNLIGLMGFTLSLVSLTPCLVHYSWKKS